MDYVIKISGLIINSSKELLLFRSKNKTVWTCPGGKIEEGEIEIECLKRELKEESNIDLISAEFLLETPIEPAAGNPGKFVQMKFYIVKEYSGELKLNPDDNVEEFKWISKEEFENNLQNKAEGKDFIEIGSGLELYAIPQLIEKGLI